MYHDICSFESFPSGLLAVHRSWCFPFSQWLTTAIPWGCERWRLLLLYLLCQLILLVGQHTLGIHLFGHVQLDHAQVGGAQGKAMRLQLLLEHTTRIVDHGAHALCLLMNQFKLTSLFCNHDYSWITPQRSPRWKCQSLRRMFSATTASWIMIFSEQESLKLFLS